LKEIKELKEFLVVLGCWVGIKDKRDEGDEGVEGEKRVFSSA
jgi:hypothetical protein